MHSNLFVFRSELLPACLAAFGLPSGQAGIQLSYGTIWITLSLKRRKNTLFHKTFINKLTLVETNLNPSPNLSFSSLTKNPYFATLAA